MSVPNELESVVALIISYYTALAEGRADDVGALTKDHFADGAVLRRPETLPGGGEIVGAERIARFMQRAASSVGELTLRSVNAVADGDVVNVYAELSLFLGITTTAIEWWRVKAGEVESVTAYYWDTAALLAAAKG